MRMLWRGRAGDVVVPVALTALVVSASVWQLVPLPLAAAAALIGGMRGGVRRGAWALLLSAACGAAAVIGSVRTVGEVLSAAVLIVAAGVFPWTLGVVWRARRDAREAAVALAAERDLARRRETDARRAAERSLLAEELHDDLGHVLSLVALDLGRLELDRTVADDARGSIARARAEVSAAVVRLGSSVEALRGDEPPPLVSRHRRADLDQLLAGARAAGATIEVVGRPAADRLAAFGAQTVFRTVREGITNAVKHAPRRPVTVRFTDAGERLEIAIVNPRAPQDRSTAPGAGSGLAALGERVRLAGGELRAGEERDVFALTVSLPSHRDDTAPVAPALAGGRFRPRAWIVVCAPLVVLAGLAVPVKLVNVSEARRAKLDADAFARITPGQPRAAAEALLPDATLGGGAGCARYAITADPFDDASGDYYRICFDGDVVASAERVGGGR